MFVNFSFQYFNIKLIENLEIFKNFSMVSCMIHTLKKP